MPISTRPINATSTWKARLIRAYLITQVTEWNWGSLITCDGDTIDWGCLVSATIWHGDGDGEGGWARDSSILWSGDSSSYVLRITQFDLISLIRQKTFIDSYECIWVRSTCDGYWGNLFPSLICTRPVKSSPTWKTRRILIDIGTQAAKWVASELSTRDGKIIDHRNHELASWRHSNSEWACAS